MSGSKLAIRITDPSARGIAQAVGQLIRSGELAVGERLPTVRSLARELGVSPATVSQAWQLLARQRVVQTRGKAGTVVCAPPSVPVQPRSVSGAPPLPIDLSSSLPDPALLPDLAPALAHAAAQSYPNSYSRPSLYGPLEEVLRARWPFAPQRMLAVNGGFDGVMSICSALLGPGDRVAVEDPTAARLLDILEYQQLEPVPVTCDAYGPLPDALAAALTTGVRMVLIQPRAQEPAGHALSDERAQQLAAVLEPHEAFVVEDDGKAELSTQPAISLGTYLPDRTIRVHSYNKSHGLDLRIGVVAGAREYLDQVERQRVFAGGWTSYYLQAALTYLLTDGPSERRVAEARRTYRRRRERFAQALARHGVTVENRDGQPLWVPVRDEHSTILSLAAKGISVTPGSHFTVGRWRQHYVRVVPSRLAEGIDAIAGQLAESINAPTAGTVAI